MSDLDWYMIYIYIYIDSLYIYIERDIHIDRLGLGGVLDILFTEKSGLDATNTTNEAKFE